MFLKRGRQQRGTADHRQVTLNAYVQELMTMDATELMKLAPAEPGFWGVSALSTQRAGLDLAVQAFRPWDKDCSDDIQFVAEVVSHHRIHRVFAEGFAIRGGMVEPLSDGDWRLWNL